MAFMVLVIESDIVSWKHTLRGRPSANFDVWFFDDHALLYLSAAGTTKFGSHEPFPVGIGKDIDRESALAELVVGKLSWSKAYGPIDLGDIRKGGSIVG
jgi:hypothetical protein